MVSHLDSASINLHSKSSLREARQKFTIVPQLGEL